MDHHHRPQPRDRPPAARPVLQAKLAALEALAREEPDECPTTACGSCSPAATRRWPPRRRRADPAHARRALGARDRARVPRRRPAMAKRLVRAKRKSPTPDRLPRAVGGRAAAPPAVGPRVCLPDLQRGLRGDGREALVRRELAPRRSGSAAAGRADARPARAAWAAGADAAAPRRGATRASTPTPWCCSPTRTVRCGTPARSRRAARSAAAAGPTATGCRRRSRSSTVAPVTRWERIAVHYTALRGDRAEPGDRAQPRRRDRDGRGPEHGLALIDTIEGLDAYHLLHSARADLLRRLAAPRTPAPPTSARRAGRNPVERAFPRAAATRQLDELAPAISSSQS